ncbi:unnamed protein product [Psylliodes chrysocephalus]|uniref:PHD-type domain-containing protein n=1 Tax=Psylliodes chrysocephalus TaxID=3402493 RepID=A0A9P0GKC1_9CUCU|nr:unnamed protein product [Psylliodes chrysocephala]
MVKKKQVKCKGCKSNITKTQSSLRCNGNCKEWFHKKCTRLSNEDYKIYSDRKSNKKWLCYDCVSSSSESDSSQDESNSEPVSEDIAPKKRKTKKKSIVKKHEDNVLNSSNPSNKEIMQYLKKRFSELEQSVQLNLEGMDDIHKKLENMSKDKAVLRKEQKVLKNRVEELERKIEKFNHFAEKEEVDQKGKNVIIFGLCGGNPVKDDIKKVFKKIRFEIKNSEYGIQTLPSKESRKPVLVKLKEKSIRDKLLELKKMIKLDTLECELMVKAK